MFDLCKILGVEEGEVFKLNGFEYKIINNKMYSKSNLNCISSNNVFMQCDYPLNLLADAEFERVPFVPSVGDNYWTVVNNKDGFIACRQTASNFRVDILLVKFGICYRTEKEAREKGIPLMEQWKKELGW